MKYWDFSFFPAGARDSVPFQKLFWKLISTFLTFISICFVSVFQLLNNSTLEKEKKKNFRTKSFEQKFASRILRAHLYRQCLSQLGIQICQLDSDLILFSVFSIEYCWLSSNTLTFFCIYYCIILTITNNLTSFLSSFAIFYPLLVILRSQKYSI